MKAPKNFSEKIKGQILQTIRGKVSFNNYENNGKGIDDKFWVFDNSDNDTVFHQNALLFELDWNKYNIKVKKCKKGDGTNGEYITEKSFLKKDCTSLQNFAIMVKDIIETEFKNRNL